MPNNDEPNFDAAKIRLPDGRVAYDAVKLAGIPTEGLFLVEYPSHIITVRTQNTIYELVTDGSRVTATEIKPDGSFPRFIETPGPIHINGSTWGGSMLKLDYIGVGMHMEFSIPNTTYGVITTSAIASISVAPVPVEAKAHE